MIIAGLTGAIGSGKSTVTQLFADLGAYTIRADDIARDLAESDLVAIQRIRSTFGDSYFDKDGNLNRRLLGRYVFANPKAREKLNAILHPRTIEIIDAQINQKRREGDCPAVIVEAALIFEVGLDKKYRPVIVVDSSIENIFQRVKQRDKLTDTEIKHRLSSQMPARDKVAQADFVILNDGSLLELKQKVKELFPKVLNFKS